MRQDETAEGTAFHYGDYLRSERWQALREAALAEAEERCRVCNSSDDLNVHHRSYDRLGKPGEDRDLVVLCEICHEGFHFVVDRQKRRAKRVSLYRDDTPPPTGEDIKRAGGAAEYFYGNQSRADG